jgi:DNA-binding transcriptional MocR family regulator
MRNIVTFEGKPPQGTIHFGVGQPSADLLPIDLIHEATEEFFRSAASEELNYGVLQGDQKFRDSLATFLTKNYGRPVGADSLFVTCGNSQALDLVCSHLSRRGDTILVEEPCYFLAFQIFADHGLNIVSVPVDEAGLDVEQLERTLARTSPTLLYTIPSYQNPSGQTMSAARRERLVELSQEHDFMILADEVYQLLSYYDPPPAALGTMSASGTVLSFGSFSKILAPALRLGWIQTSPEISKRLTEIGAVNSGGSLNHFTSHIVRCAIDKGLQQAHLEKLRNTYRARVEAMDAALEEHLSDHATWTRPDGGYFFWLRLNENLDVRELQRRAVAMKTGFQEGELFSGCSGMKNHIRLSFAYYNESDLLEGITRLKTLFQ